MNTAVAEPTFNVVCMGCGQVFTPAPRTPLWWNAKHYADRYPNRLDALHITAKQCGCERERPNPDAPYRVFGYDGLMQDFDTPFQTFAEAVEAFVELSRTNQYVLFISGVSEAVQSRLSLL